MESFLTINGHIMTIQICAKPIKIIVAQVYAPTTEATDLETGFQYQHRKTIVYILGDFNAKVDNQAEKYMTSNFGLGERKKQAIVWLNFGMKIYFPI